MITQAQLDEIGNRAEEFVLEKMAIFERAFNSRFSTATPEPGLQDLFDQLSELEEDANLPLYPPPPGQEPVYGQP